MMTVVQITRHDRVFTFTLDERPPLTFWKISTPGYPSCPSLVQVMGDEPPVFFEKIADIAWREMRAAAQMTSTIT